MLGGREPPVALKSGKWPSPNSGEVSGQRHGWLKPRLTQGLPVPASWMVEAKGCPMPDSTLPALLLPLLAHEFEMKEQGRGREGEERAGVQCLWCSVQKGLQTFWHEGCIIDT